MELDERRIEPPEEGAPRVVVDSQELLVVEDRAVDRPIGSHVRDHDVGLRESVQVAPPSVDFQTCTSESGLVGEKQRVPM